MSKMPNKWKIWLIFLITNILTLVLMSQPAAAQNLDDILQFWMNRGKFFQSLPPDLRRTQLAKAPPDECFKGIGDPGNQYSYFPPSPNCQQIGGVPKVNQAYIWGLTQCRDLLWFGTIANTHCLVLGAFLGLDYAHVTDSWVCEFSARTASPPKTDWRPPKIYSYNVVTKELIDRTVTLPPSALVLLQQTTGLRSAGTSKDGVVFLAGPGFAPIINVFAFDGATGNFLGAQALSGYNDIRRWLLVNGVLYCGVGKSGSGPQGAVLRWRGNKSNPFQFEEVGLLGSSAADLAYHESRIFVNTWPAFGGGGGEMNSLYMSPRIPTGGLTNAHVNGWTRLWQASNYDPDVLVPNTYGGGAIMSFGGYLYWGTMHVPLLATMFALDDLPWNPNLEPIPQFLNAAFGTHRSVAIFRGRNFGTSMQKMEVVYGEKYLPVYDSNLQMYTFARDNAHKTKMGPPKWGLSGYGNFFNTYTWSMAVYRSRLYVGTFDWSYLLVQGLEAFMPSFAERLAVDPNDLLRNFNDALNRLAKGAYGADLFRHGTDGFAEMVSSDGVGNYSSYGIRNMLASGNNLYLGMANPMNLLTDTADEMTEGGWELIKVFPKWQLHNLP